MQLQFCGAARTVTGSCYYLNTGKVKVLIDCGAFQGNDELEARNREAFPFDPSEIQYVLLTHAHFDHTGRLPLLVKQGFTGRIICTQPTRDLASIILQDAAKIQKEEYERFMVKAKNSERRDENSAEDGSQYENFEPLYSSEDVAKTIAKMDVYPYGMSINITDGLEVRMRDAGHILGSASFEVWAENDAGRTRKIVFSGDIGQPGKRIIRDPDMVSEADYVVIESTYGNRLHRNKDETVLEFLSILKEAQENGGNVLIPVFAVERAQEIIYEINLFVENNLINDLEIYLDSPMAIAATEIFRKYPTFYDEDARRLLEKGDDPFAFHGLKFTETAQESMRLVAKNNVVIMAGSGMANGGRIIHHIANNIEKENTSIIFVGFQVAGTLGRKLMDEEPYIKIKGKTLKHNARVYTLNGFSGHADVRDLRYWLRSFGRSPRMTYVVHGEEAIAETFAKDIEKELQINAYVPSQNEVVTLE